MAGRALKIPEFQRLHPSVDHEVSRTRQFQNRFHRIIDRLCPTPGRPSSDRPHGNFPAFGVRSNPPRKPRSERPIAGLPHAKHLIPWLTIHKTQTLTIQKSGYGHFQNRFHRIINFLCPPLDRPHRNFPAFGVRSKPPRKR
jgi:hypothetical protein